MSEEKQMNLGEGLKPPEAPPKVNPSHFKPGNKGGGRPAGSKNKRSGAIDEIFSNLGHNAADRLIWLSKRVEKRLAALDAAHAEISDKGGVVAPSEALREDEQLFYQTNKTLLEYQYPKLRAIEVSASRFSGVQFVINAGGEKSATGEVWMEESLEENLEIAKERQAEEIAREIEKERAGE